MRIIDLKQIQQYYESQATLSGGLCMGGLGQGKETKNLNVVNVLTIQESV
jgi:hypothetical protein